MSASAAAAAASLDISPEMLRNARHTLDPRVRTLVADLEDLPVPTGGADLVVCSLGPLQETSRGSPRRGACSPPAVGWCS